MGGARQAHDARDRIADEESQSRETTVSHKDAVPAENEQRVGGDDLARSLSNPGDHLVRRPVRTQDDHFAVLIGDDRASIREEPAGLDELEDVVARVGAVAVDGVFGEGEGGSGLGDAEVLDDLDAGAVGGLDLEVAGAGGVAVSGEEGCGQDESGVGSDFAFGVNTPLRLY